MPSRGRALSREAWFPQPGSASTRAVLPGLPQTRGAPPGLGCSGLGGRAGRGSAASTAPASRGHPVLCGGPAALGRRPELPALLGGELRGAAGAERRAGSPLAGTLQRIRRRGPAGRRSGPTSQNPLHRAGPLGAPGARVIHQRPPRLCLGASPRATTASSAPGCKRCAAFGSAGAGSTLLHGKPATPSRRRQPPEGGRGGLRLGIRAAAGSASCSPPRSELHRTLRRLHVPAARRGLGAPGCVSRAGPGPKNRSCFPGNGGEDGRGLRPVRNPRSRGFALFGDRAGGPCSALGLSHRSRARFPAALLSTGPGLPGPSPARSLNSCLKYPSCIYAGQSGVELGG